MFERNYSRVSINEVASHWIEEGLEKKYPDLYRQVIEKMEKATNRELVVNLEKL